MIGINGGLAQYMTFVEQTDEYGIKKVKDRIAFRLYLEPFNF